MHREDVLKIDYSQALYIVYFFHSTPIHIHYIYVCMHIHNSSNSSFKGTLHTLRRMLLGVTQQETK